MQGIDFASANNVVASRITKALGNPPPNLCRGLATVTRKQKAIWELDSFACDGPGLWKDSMRCAEA